MFRVLWKILNLKIMRLKIFEQGMLNICFHYSIPFKNNSMNSLLGFYCYFEVSSLSDFSGRGRFWASIFRLAGRLAQLRKPTPTSNLKMIPVRNKCQSRGHGSDPFSNAACAAVTNVASGVKEQISGGRRCHSVWPDFRIILIEKWGRKWENILKILKQSKYSS